MKFLAAAITALILFSAATTMACAPERLLYFKDALGRTLTMPVCMEKEVAEPLPFDQQAVLEEARKALSARVFDLSSMSRPEPDADDVPEELKHLITR
jgi:hypothetical protein